MAKVEGRKKMVSRSHTVVRSKKEVSRSCKVAPGKKHSSRSQGEKGADKKMWASMSPIQEKVSKSKKQSGQQRPHGVVYARQSSGSTWTHGRKRQLDAGARALHDHFAGKGAKKADIKKVAEITSGSLPLCKRKTLVNLITDPKVDAIGVENLRAISRRMVYGEMLYELAKKHDKRIVPLDMPDIFDLNPHPNQAYSRRAVLNAQEYEKDSIEWRTGRALRAKLLDERQKSEKTMRRNQDGEAKVNGRKSILEHIQPKASARKKLITLCKQRQRGKFGWRALAQRLSAALKLDAVMSHEAARRTSNTLLG